MIVKFAFALNFVSTWEGNFFYASKNYLGAYIQVHVGINFWVHTQVHLKLKVSGAYLGPS
jgi:hypothetical protein